MLKISNSILLPFTEIEFIAIRAQGAGGQHVNKVSSAIHLRFDINKSSLPAFYKSKLMQLRDYRITSDGLIIIKAQRFRSQELNREDAIYRLLALIQQAGVVTKKRISTKPSKSSVTKRLEGKTLRSQLKKFRGKSNHDE